jgi:hypothetical protein
MLILEHEKNHRISHDSNTSINIVSTYLVATVSHGEWLGGGGVTTALAKQARHNINSDMVASVNETQIQI